MSKSLRKTLAIALAAAIMFSAFAGFTPATTKAAKTITLWGSQDDQAMLRILANKFVHTSVGKGYSIKLGVCGEDVAATTILQDVSAAGDVFAFASDQIASLKSAGALMPVTIDTKKIIAANSAASIKACTVGSQLYAYPSSADTYFLYYDKKYLKAKDVTSLEKIMSKTVPSGVKKFAMNLNNNGWYVASFFLTAGCKLFGNSGIDSTKCDFNGAKGVLGATYMMNLVKKGGFVDWGTNFDSTLVQNFKNRKIASAVSGTWNAAKIQEALGSSYAATKLPTIKMGGKDVQMSSFSNFKLYGVNSHTKYAKVAMALAEYLISYNSQKIRFRERSFAPTNVKLASDTTALSSNAAVAADALQSKYATLQPSIKQMQNFWTPVGNLGTTMENRKTTASTLKSDLNKMVKSILAKLS